jgi:hypothetical protein
MEIGEKWIETSKSGFKNSSSFEITFARPFQNQPSVLVFFSGFEGKNDKIVE